MTIIRSQDQSQIFISQEELAQRIISDFLHDDFTSATYRARHNQVLDDKPYYRIKFLSNIMSIIYLARLPDLLLATADVATEAQLSKKWVTTKLRFG